MLISIITVVYNGKSTIDTLLASVRNLKGRINCEFVVIDGASTDGTYELLKKNIDIIDVLVSEKDNGIYDAMNKSLRYASGDYCVFMGSDDEIICKNFEIFVGYLKKNDHIYHGLVQKSESMFGRKTNFWRILRENIPHQATFYPRILFKSRDYNITYPICADHEYNIWAFYNGFKYKFVPFVVAKFGEGGCSSISKDHKFERDYFKIVKENAGIIMVFIIGFGKILKRAFTSKFSN